jgi:hypothetical protein
MVLQLQKDNNFSIWKEMQNGKIYVENEQYPAK